MRLSFEAQFKTEFNGGKKCLEFPLQMNPAQPYWVGVTLSDPHWYSAKTQWAPNDPPLTHNDPPFRPPPTWITPNYPTIVPKDLDWTNSTNYCEHLQPSSPPKKATNHDLWPWKPNIFIHNGPWNLFEKMRDKQMNYRQTRWMYKS